MGYETPLSENTATQLISSGGNSTFFRHCLMYSTAKPTKDAVFCAYGKCFINMKMYLWEVPVLFMPHRKWLHFLISAAVLFLTSSGAVAHAQKALRNDDISLSVFGQFTSTVTGNGITQRTSNSAGAQAAFRHTYHWWLGFEGAYGYTRFTEFYSNRPFSYQHNLHEFSGSYLVQGHKFFGFEPFATVGISALIFSPSLNGGQGVPWQGKPALNYGVGVNYALISSHFGVRAQYRGIYYKAPDFSRSYLMTGASRQTSEPMVGLYVRF
jgi:hypothetical protein